MRKVCTALLLIIIFSLLSEVVDIFGFSRFQPSAAIVLSSNEAMLTWSRLPYWAYYEVEVLNRSPETSSQTENQARRLMHFTTWKNHFTIAQDFPFRTYWRVSASGIFQRPLGKWSEVVPLGDSTAEAAPNFVQLKPQETKKILPEQMNSDKPILTWTVVQGAVYYEIEFLDQPPENPNDIYPSIHRVRYSREVFINGYNPDLSEFHGQRLYWRVRALEVTGEPIGVYSDASVINVKTEAGSPQKPLIVSDYYARNAVPLLYPIYVWIPIHGAALYEVELTRVPPENPNTIEPSIHRIWHTRAAGFDAYDDTPRIEPGRYYYRVRGLTRDHEPVGVWSETAYFDVTPEKASYAATFGDSITHGGGAISYSPAHWEYDYQSYLSFPTYNLGRSADTSETTAERFERDVLPFKPQYLIIMTGANSLRAGASAGYVTRDLADIREKCLRNNIRPIFLTLPPINPDAIFRSFNEETAPNWRDELQGVNAWIRQQPYYIDLYPQFVDATGELPDRYAIDGLHYDISGKKLMAKIINDNWSRVTQTDKLNLR